jgi:hypothetical protein
MRCGIHKEREREDGACSSKDIGCEGRARHARGVRNARDFVRCTLQQRNRIGRGDIDAQCRGAEHEEPNEREQRLTRCLLARWNESDGE